VNSAFSEFTYGFAVATAFTRRSGEPRVIPIFPSLTDEATLGYDALLRKNGKPLFLQFKVPKWISRRSLKMPPGFTTPYYRMHLHSRRISRQHAILVALDSGGQKTFYVSARFHTLPDLSSRYSADTVLQGSAFFRPSRIGPIADDAQHWVAYQGAGNRWFRQSPVTTVGEGHIDFDAFMRDIHDATGDAASLASELEESASVLIRVIRDVLPATETGGDHVLTAIAPPIGPLDLVAYVARAYLDAQLVVLVTSR
jgi:hypothetical protein